ncbi:spore germination protein [Pullulanibacillus sp. KACC 23026]|uniref:spore germination protein n=1 Tax=Pullulanibacillus sp. KACC 23026 TaxID=3028315 RepID=UPI0023B1621E|nr:spore germination protein [Pullulanibacillus sp. KACC 23026]WEG13223.1 spore germination protein [Pullulanibacillus sp. KACC 23026]
MRRLRKMGKLKQSPPGKLGQEQSIQKDSIQEEESREEEANQKDYFGKLRNSSDFVLVEHGNYRIYYIKPLIKAEVVQRSILPFLPEGNGLQLEEIKQKLPIEKKLITSVPKDVQDSLLHGFIAIELLHKSEKLLLLEAIESKARQVTIPEVEYSVVGPKEAFVEALEVNLNLIRKRIPLPTLVVKSLNVGHVSKSQVAVLYIEGIANKENVNTVIQRLKDIDFDFIADSSFLTQMISDNSNTPFPLLIDTERPDRVAAVLNEGKVAILVDGSPEAIYGPTTLVEFFSSFEDYFLSWPIASFFRLVRLFSVLFSIFITPLYVSVMTFHYELVPRDLLSPLITSRLVVPFPPVLETLILEVTIELLREAGARLPSKVGQTIGIVGGLVIGTASVEAGLTSNVLLILVALAALASFITPVYRMSNTIRLLRFPLIILASQWGIIGVTLGFVIMVIHLIKLKSIGRPYLEPIFPPRVQDLKDSFIRLPYSKQKLRPVLMQSERTNRMKQGTEYKDIDE